MREPQLKVPFDYIVGKFKEMDPNEISNRLDIHYHEEDKSFHLEMMGDIYKVCYPSGRTVDSDGAEIFSYVLRTILIRYLVNGSGAPLTGEFVTYKEIQDGQVYYPNFYKRTILRLAQLYDSYEENFRMNAEKLSVDYDNKGSLSFYFTFLKNVQFYFIMYQGDEEFEASANILMDKNTETYFNAEDLAVVVDVAMEYFIQGSIPKEIEMYNYVE